MQDLVLLQTFLGLSLAVGIVASGSSINKTCQIANSRKIRISRQYVCQGCVILVSISIVIFSMLSTGYHTLCIVTWVYGLGLGGYRCKCPVKSFSQIDLFIHFLLTFFGRFIKDARAGASSGEVFYARLGWVAPQVTEKLQRLLTLILIRLRFYQGSWINSGSNINPVDGISQRCFADVGQGGLLYLLGTDSHLGGVDVLHRIPEELFEVSGG